MNQLKVKTIGFPRIHNYPGDIRDFTPNLFKYLDKFQDLRFFLEEGYGGKAGFTQEDYSKVCSVVKFVPYEETLTKDMTVILKMPDLKELEKLNDNSAMYTMSHYDTRPEYVKLFARKNINTYSMDSIVDDYGIRMFVDYFGTAYSGCEVAVETLRDTMKDFYSTERKPIVASILGAGGVGQNCIKALEILSDKEFLGKGILGIVPQVVTRTITCNEEALKDLFSDTHILVDATKRRDPTQQILCNELIGYLPEDAVILDLSADRYDASSTPPIVRGIEGTAKGSPEHMVIPIDDELYNEIPDFVDSTNRRVVVSSDAWPSYHPVKSINYYEIMMKDYLSVLLSKDLSEITVNSDNTFERGLSRATLSYYTNKAQ
jgi:alanine dehydrogenase